MRIQCDITPFIYNFNRFVRNYITKILKQLLNQRLPVLTLHEFSDTCNQRTINRLARSRSTRSSKTKVISSLAVSKKKKKKKLNPV